MPSLFDKIAASIAPEPSDRDRAEARQKARDKATPGDWLSLVLQHHLEIEEAFGNAKTAHSMDGRAAACKRLALVLVGHAQAEETVLYPAMALKGGESGKADHAYDEQALVKIAMAKLENLQPLSQEWVGKLEEIRAAVAHHMYEEEGTWFPKLHAEAGADKAKLTQRFHEEFERYTHGETEPHRAAAE